MPATQTSATVADWGRLRLNPNSPKTLTSLYNPLELDLIQIINEGGELLYNVTWKGAAQLLPNGIAIGSGGPGGDSAVLAELGVAANYELLAYSGITNTGATVITGGNIGSSSVPATLSGMTLTPPAIIDNAGSGAARTAGNSAFLYYSGLPATMALTTADIGSSGLQHSPGAANGTYYAGVYVSPSSIAITTPITLDAQGNPNALFVFYSTASTVTQAIAGTINLVNGALANNVIWVVGSSWTTIGPGAVTVGNILAYASVTLGGGTLSGRALAVGGGNGAVTISTAVIATAPTAAASGTVGTGLFSRQCLFGKYYTRVKDTTVPPLTAAEIFADVFSQNRQQLDIFDIVGQGETPIWHLDYLGVPYFDTAVSIAIGNAEGHNIANNF